MFLAIENNQQPQGEPMKFNIEIELENGDYCNGCPCVREYSVTNHSETINLIDCNLYGVNQSKGKEDGLLIRPDFCKEQNKEKTK